MSYAIDVRNLTKKIKNNAIVDHINIRVQRGKIYGFLGPNGSGKTTTMRMLCGLLSSDDGEGHCLGFDFKKESDKIKSQVGYMTQKFSFWEDLTIRENLEFTVKMFQKDNIEKRVRKSLEKAGLTSRAEQLAGTLSGGWKQRLALTACLIHEPKLLLLDEPTAGVDPKARKAFWEDIRNFADSGFTVLVSTHYTDEAERCDKIIYIAYGSIMAEGTVSEIMCGFSSMEDSFIYYTDNSLRNKL
ncbi:MAG: ABC transporter ATP-binding protein [Holosporaceae bacterium]|jgi:ABC-2 type transport system ATP-binding protein|nr:ABC transporter ATP-binding protein [Holosporaceae bacterium]